MSDASLTDRPPRSRTASDQVVPALAAAAERVLDRDGEVGVTIRTVAREANVAPMSVYNRFGSREGLVVALAVRSFAQLGSWLTTTRPVAVDEHFRRLCAAYRDYALTFPARYRLVFSVGTPLKLPEADDASFQGRAALGHLVDAVAALADDDPALASLDVIEAAQTVWSALHGAVTIELAGIGQTEDPERSYAHLVDLLRRGLAPGEPVRFGFSSR